jgi:hypothetical protein
VTDIVNTIAQGRANTDMPSWSVRYAGAMDDQQIADVLNYLIEINREKVPQAQNLCTNPQAAASPSAAASGSPTASPATTPPTPSAPTSPSPTP